MHQTLKADFILPILRQLSFQNTPKVLKLYIAQNLLANK